MFQGYIEKVLFILIKNINMKLWKIMLQTLYTNYN